MLRASARARAYVPRQHVAAVGVRRLPDPEKEPEAPRPRVNGGELGADEERARDQRGGVRENGLHDAAIFRGNRDRDVVFMVLLVEVPTGDGDGRG